jgi:phage terminase large subunit-like protein
MATDDDAPDPARLVKLGRQALSSAEFRRRFHLIDFWGPGEFYPPQLELFLKGVKHRQRLIRGGNQVGKSFACAFEVALHMSGNYFSWWRGRKFTRPIRCWVVGPTLQSVRDGAQKQLTARDGEFGTGTIPISAFVGKPVMIPGGTGGIDTISVAHQTDGKANGVSTLTFKSFEQGVSKLQSEGVDLIWVDERCSEEVYSELLARTIATDGSILISYTPLKGGGELTYRFLNEPDPDRCDIRIDENDALHIPVEPGADRAESSGARTGRAHPRYSDARHCPRVSPSAHSADAKIRTARGLGAMGLRHRLRHQPSVCRCAVRMDTRHGTVLGH